VKLGIGDDLAVLNWASENLLLVGVDQVLDGVHFDSSVHSPQEIGRKAMNRNLSDCAAMGCLPAAAVVTLALPKGIGDQYAKELFLGMKNAGEIFDCPIVGGDTGSWPGKLVVTITILGHAGKVPPVTRGGARPGDLIYVTGPLGGSILGRHMTFEPRVKIGRELARVASAMIDLSDGLSRDLAHICRESGVGAIIHAGSVPVHADAIEMRGHSPLDHALNDGEDYELLFTANQPGNPLLKEVVCIGEITASPEILLLHPGGSREPLAPKSWQHTF
jgi:thiamine-monophosphate kinase